MCVATTVLLEDASPEEGGDNTMMCTDERLQRHCWRTIFIERREEVGDHDHNDANPQEEAQGGRVRVRLPGQQVDRRSGDKAPVRGHVVGGW